MERLFHWGRLMAQGGSLGFWGFGVCGGLSCNPNPRQIYPCVCGRRASLADSTGLIVHLQRFRAIAQIIPESLYAARRAFTQHSTVDGQAVIEQYSTSCTFFERTAWQTMFLCRISQEHSLDPCMTPASHSTRKPLNAAAKAVLCRSTALRPT